MKSILNNAQTELIQYDQNTINDVAMEYLDVHKSDSVALPTDIPMDPNEFYKDLGLLEHPFTGALVPNLTDYQQEFWKAGQTNKYRLAIKSQKTGFSTSSIMEDFQRAITSCRGKEILVIAQSFDHAKDHLYTLRKMISNSKKYSPFLIKKPTELLLRDEVTKVSMIYIRNPDNALKPTRIIALGPMPGGIWSWKEVKHIHMSDITAQQQMVDDSETFGAAFSRLANTQGTMVIETPPRGPSGKVYDIYEQSKLKKKMGNDELSEFFVGKYPASLAVKAGLITEEFLRGERERLGPSYDMYYNCDFYNSASTFYKITKDQTDGDYDLE